MLIRELRSGPGERWVLHGALFLLTFLTVAAGGALFGPQPDWFQGLRPGLFFASALMAILLTHECGHYFLAKLYRINVSPPYFIPAPWFWNFVGTFGAFIRLRSPVADRRQLMDIGAAGPWAGFVVALLFLVVGLMQSETIPGTSGSLPFVVFFRGQDLRLGDSVVTWLLRHWLVGDGPVQLHPLAAAGWVGVFVTALNLLPLGQLDGGHILYALFGEWQKTIGRLAWLALIPLGTLFVGWWFWAALILLFSGGRISHPAVLDRHRALPPSRFWLGAATIALFALTFMPAPFDWPFRAFDL